MSHASQNVRNCLVEFEFLLHNAFISGYNVGDEYDTTNNMLAVVKNKIVHAIRNDIGTAR